MKRRVFIKTSSFSAGSVLLFSGLTSTRGYASTSSTAGCEWELIPIGLQFALHANFSKPDDMGYWPFHDQVAADVETSVGIARNAQNPFAVFLANGFTNDSVSALFEYSCDGIRGPAKIPPELGISATMAGGDDSIDVTIYICVKMFSITLCPSGGEISPPDQPPAYDGPGSPQQPGAPPEWEPPSTPPPEYIADLTATLPEGYL